MISDPKNRQIIQRKYKSQMVSKERVFVNFKIRSFEISFIVPIFNVCIMQ